MIRATGYFGESRRAVAAAEIEGRKAMHHYNYGSTQKGDNRGTAAFAECTHPVFRTHEDTGRKAVYVNRLMTVKSRPRRIRKRRT